MKQIDTLNPTHPIDLALIVPYIYVWVHQCLVHTNPPFWIHHKHLFQQFPCHTGFESAVLCTVGWEKDVRKEFVKRVASITGSVFYIVPHSGLQTLHEIRGRSTKLLNDFIPLVDVWARVKCNTSTNTWVSFRQICFYHYLRPSKLVTVELGYKDTFKWKFWNWYPLSTHTLVINVSSKFSC